MKAYKFSTGNPDQCLPRITDKAYCFTRCEGYTSLNDSYIYFPKSQCKLSEPNEVGNYYITIPKWLFFQNKLDVNGIRELNYISEV